MEPRNRQCSASRACEEEGAPEAVGQSQEKVPAFDHTHVTAERSAKEARDRQEKGIGPIDPLNLLGRRPASHVPTNS